MSPIAGMQLQLGKPEGALGHIPGWILENSPRRAL
jgi:hypothetical protein